MKNENFSSRKKITVYKNEFDRDPKRIKSKIR